MHSNDNGNNRQETIDELPDPEFLSALHELLTWYEKELSKKTELTILNKKILYLSAFALIANGVYSTIQIIKEIKIIQIISIGISKVINWIP